MRFFPVIVAISGSCSGSVYDVYVVFKHRQSLHFLAAAVRGSSSISRWRQKSNFGESL